MSERSPAPWRVESDEPYHMAIRDASGRGIAEVFLDDAPVHDYNEMQYANAHLLAAAPDLLEALRPFAAREECDIGVIPETADELHLVGCGECGTIMAARAAIAKAEGR